MAKKTATKTETKVKATKKTTAKAESKVTAAKVEAPAVQPTAKKRGRPAKTINMSAETKVEAPAVQPTAKKRGRPAKAVTAATEPKAVKTTKAVKKTAAPKAVKKVKENEELFNEEINYITARIKRAENKGVKEVGHYSYLLTSTLKYLANMGITHKPCGKHGYIFQVPRKNSAAWKKVMDYKMQ